MTTPERSSAPRPWWLLVGFAIAVLAVGATALWRPWGVSAEPVADQPIVAAEESGAVAETPVIAPAPLALPEEPTVLIFGDSWTYGSAAIEPTLGYAYVISATLGWDATVDGVRGSGYLKPGIDGDAYGARITNLDPDLDPDLVIVEGSINDRRLYDDGYRAVVEAAWDDLAALYPNAAIVILGPAPQVLPVEMNTARIDEDLAAIAAQRGWWYISPVQDDWITDANYAAVIDTSEIGNDHPSTEGHAYLAARLSAALEEFSQTSDVLADAPDDLP